MAVGGWGWSGRALQLLQVVVEAVEAAFPEVPVHAEPLVEFAEGGRAEGADAAVADGGDFDQARVGEDAQVLGGLGLADLQAGGDLADGEGLFGQQLDDVQAVRFGQRAEGRGVQRGLLWDEGSG